MHYTHLFFDLDGTLTESGPGITNCVKYALEKFGINENDEGNLKRFIGPPLVDSFMTFYGFSESDAREAMRLYRERFGTIGIFENSVYEGIPETLAKLKDSGKKLYVATSKPEIYVPRILDHFDLSKYFEDAEGSDIKERSGRRGESQQNRHDWRQEARHNRREEELAGVNRLSVGLRLKEGTFGAWSHEDNRES